jgi:Ni2+-binding GTPase involved in maturation of urease and hydrogenase
MHLAAAVAFDPAPAMENIQSVRSGMKVLNVSAKTGDGMDEWLSLLESKLAEFK